MTEGGNSPRLLTEESTNYDQGSGEERPPSPPNSVSRHQLPERLLTIHRTCVRTDLIDHFRDLSILNCSVDFRIINERGELEPGVGNGVICEVYSLFWNEFSISMTIG